jgi:hypothetical protein
MPAPSNYRHEAIPPRRNAFDKASTGRSTRTTNRYSQQSSQSRSLKTEEHFVSMRTENCFSVSLNASHNNLEKISTSSSFFSVKNLRERLIGGSLTTNNQTTRQAVEETRSCHKTSAISLEVSAGRQGSRSKNNSKKR